MENKIVMFNKELFLSLCGKYNVCLSNTANKPIINSKTLPDMREKVREYISELDVEYDRCMDWIEEHMDGEACQVSAMEMRAKTLMEVKNDLQSRLEELV